MTTKPALYFFIVLLSITSCGPTKGYEGPDLPLEKLGLVIAPTIRNGTPYDFRMTMEGRSLSSWDNYQSSSNSSECS